MQGSQEWKNKRVGKFTASEIWKICNPSKDFSQVGMTYINEKASELVTGYGNEFISEAVVHGTMHEPKARLIYEIETGYSVTEVDFLEWPDMDLGASPDGIIEGSHGLEIKCPFKTSNAFELYLAQSAEDLKQIEPKYYWQVMCNLLVSGLPRWDFVVYDLFLYEKFGHLKILQIEPDEAALQLILTRTEKAIALRDELIDRINKLYS